MKAITTSAAIRWIGLTSMWIAWQSMAEGQVVRLRKVAFDAPAEHVLAAVKIESTGETLPVQSTDGDQHVCLLPALKERSPALSPVWLNADRRGDVASMFQPDVRRVVEIREEDGALEIRVRGKLVTTYHYKGTPKPFFFPVLGPGGAAMTRGFPMRSDNPDEPRDHPHHRSLWFAFGRVNGHDFWTEHEGTGTIRHVSFGEIVSGPVFGVFSSKNEWVAADGTVVCSDERTFTVYALEEARLFDYTITIRASHGPLHWGDTKEGMMAMRVAAPLQLKGKVAKGRVVTSAGLRDEKAWGRRAAWVDYSGPVEGRLVGAAIFDHPSNLRHPTWWHARDYGLFAANPFGLHDFAGEPAGSGDYELKSGEKMTFRYRIYLHAGDADGARVAEMYRAWLAE